LCVASVNVRRPPRVGRHRTSGGARLLVAAPAHYRKRLPGLFRTPPKQPHAKQSAKVLSILPRAADLYKRQMERGLDGNPREALKARVFLREWLGGKIRLEPLPDGGLMAHWNQNETALLRGFERVVAGPACGVVCSGFRAGGLGKVGAEEGCRLTDRGDWFRPRAAFQPYRVTFPKADGRGNHLCVAVPPL
jgi:hypothetical protein